jgi:repressor LexA
MSKGLTKRQAAILDHIIACIQDEGYPPTIAEIGENFGIASTNGVNDHLLALERKGYIARSSKARSIQLTDKATASIYKADVDVLPLVGRIAAGHPILAEENVEAHIPVMRAQARQGGYCLRVQGDSMIEDGIFDGDVIVVDPATRPRQGDIVVALVDEDEATVKRYYPHGETVELRPANSEMEPLFVPAGQVQLQGIVIALQRQFGR